MLQQDFGAENRETGKEDMHSISPDGELLLALLAMCAEEEACSASENQK